jgi:hypothetical protein
MNILKIFSLLALLLKNEKKQNEYCPECGGQNEYCPECGGKPITFKKGEKIIVYICGRGHVWYEKTSIFDKRK